MINGDRPIRVAMVVPSLRGGGLERVVRDLVLALDRSQFQLEVFGISGLGVYADDLQKAGIPAWDCSEAGTRIRGIPRPLIRHLRRFQPDVVHAHSGTWYPSTIARMLLRRPRLVFTDHGRYPPEPRARAWVERWCERRTDQLVAVSSPLAEYVRDFLGLPELPKVIPNGIDLEGFVTPEPGARQRLRAHWGVGEDEVLGICVGRFVPVKNHSGLLTAIAHTADTLPKFKLALLGSGMLEAELRQQTRHLSLERRVLFLGFRPDVAAHLHAADVFLMPSTTEGLPVSLLEAMASGLPTVATAVGGIPEALGDGAGGILIPPNDSLALAQAVARMATDSALRHAAGRAAQKRALDFSLEKIALRYSDLYQTVVERPVQ